MWCSPVPCFDPQAGIVVMKPYNINSSGINFQTLAHSLSHFHGKEKTRCTTTRWENREIERGKKLHRLGHKQANALAHCIAATKTQTHPHTLTRTHALFI